MKFPLPLLFKIIAMLAGCFALGAFTSCSRDKEQSSNEKDGPKNGIAAESKTNPGGKAADGSEKGTNGIVAGTENKEPHKPGITNSKPHVPAQSYNPTPAGVPYSTAHWPELGTLSRDEAVIQFLDSDSDEQRIGIIKENESGESKSFSRLLRRALQGDSEAVRRQAILSARMLDPEEATDVLSAASNDAVPELAEAAIEVAGDVVEESRLEIYRNGLKSPHPNVRNLSVVEFANARPKYSIHDLFPSLEDTDPGVGRTTSDALKGIFERDFTTADDANAWWAKNAENYDERLNFVAPKTE